MSLPDGASTNVELRHLRYFQAVARERGVGRAAAVIHVAQPALSRQIRDLEREIGVALLDRTPRGVELTPAGEALYAGVERLLQVALAALTTSRQAAIGQEGRCVLGIGRQLLRYKRMAQVVTRLQELLPGAEIAIQEVDGLEQPRQLLSGALDVGIAMVPEEESVAYEPWMFVELGAASLAADHPLAGQAELDPRDLAGEPVAGVLESRAPALVRLIRIGLTRAGIGSPQEFIYSSPQSALMMVASGRGWSPCVSPRFLDRPYPGVVTVPVRDFAVPLRIDLLSRHGETRPIVRSVLEVLRALGDERPPVLKAESARPPRGIPPGLELRHLRYFMAVAELGGFSRAAERLGTTQPSLSRQIADLEYLVGTRLLERTSRGTSVTDAGRALLSGTRTVLGELEATLGAARQARRGLVGRCAVGCIPTTAANRVITRMRRLCNEHAPGIDLVPEDYASPHQLDALREGRIDIGVGHSFLALDEAHLERRRLVDDVVDCALLAADHPLASRPRIAAAELADTPFLFMARAFAPSLHDRVYTALRSLGLEPLVGGTYDALHVVWTLAAQGKGWGLNFGVPKGEPPAGLVTVPIDGLALPWGLDILWRRHEANPAVSRVLDLLGVRAEHGIPARHEQRPRKVLD